jgi:hypothetical protein
MPTQVLVNVESAGPLDVSALTVEVNGQKEPLKSWTPVLPANAQVALLIDQGLRSSVGSELNTLRDFVREMTPGVEVMVGYMQYGYVDVAQDFTDDHQKAASSLHLPVAQPGMSASPYMCLSDYVKKWPGSGAASTTGEMRRAERMASSASHKARFVLMISSGVDPYNGSTSPMNQGSPYVDAAIVDAQRAGVAVYSIYFGGAGLPGVSANSSGQDYLNQITQATGGVNYWQGLGDPVSITPFLRRFREAITHSYIASFDAPGSRDHAHELVAVKFSVVKTKGKSGKTSLHAAEKVHPGNVE